MSFWDILKKNVKSPAAYIFAIALILSCLTACASFEKDNGIACKEYENCAVFTFDNFPIRKTASFELERAGLGEGAIYYQANIDEGTLAIKYKNSGFINEPQLLSEFSADEDMPINGSGGYVEGNKITIIFESNTPVSGEIIIAFTEDALKAVRKDLALHSHTYYYETREDAHKRIYTCDCDWLEERDFEPHYDAGNDGACDECEYYVGITHEDHNWYFDANETSHRQVFGCGCESQENFEKHYNDDGDEFCDACGWNMKDHVHTWEKCEDEFGHGWSYTCGCDTPPNFVPHTDGNGDGRCDGCEYILNEVP